MTRRLIGFLAAVSVVAACSGSVGDGPAAAPTTPPPPVSRPPSTTGPRAVTPTAAPTPPEIVPGGVITIGAQQEPPVLNPLLPGGDNDVNRLITAALLAGAFDQDPATGELRPDLVEELPTVRNGGVDLADDGTMTVTWTVHPDARWSDGAPVTGADFAFTLDVLTELRLDRNIIGFEPGALERVAAHRADDKSIAVTFSEPTVEYETLFELVLPRHLIDGADDVLSYTDSIWPSAGPFVFDTWKQGSFIRLKRNPNYWRTDESGIRLPYADRIVFRFIPDDRAQLDALGRGDIDVATLTSAATDEALEMAADSSVDVQLTRGRHHYYLAIGFDPTHAPLQNDSIAYRRAIQELIDREALAAQIHGTKTMSFESVLRFRTEEGPWRVGGRDRDGAEERIAQVCRGLAVDCATEPLTGEVFAYSPGQSDELDAVADAVTAMLDADGTAISFTPVSGFFDCFDGGLCPGVEDLRVLASVEPATAAELITYFDHSLLIWGERPSEPPPVPDEPPFDADASARYEAIRRELNSSVDVDRIRDLAEEAEQLIADQVVFVPLISRPVISATAASLDGLDPGHFAWLLTADIERWGWVGG